ncbi:DUF389 domain-containing protein [Hymenobacter caeli]|uniref:Hydrophobic protein (TIGR00271 family) n=1 Tax=Hymenobacter caeli TaxID=2735894 RepID=A0ABX2FXX6_9BACT|nr:DUF389 domain-containing protein [Hymenobacter caeli]NRT21264.1 putative hydrophobic protein (TIGR00271 family) [Hymenobacter caeli]
MLATFWRFLRTRFLLTDDMADPAEIRADVEAGIPFQGTNLWVLIFAILVASVGLNVNSTAVIIGAMLISPLMGPIVGIGYGAATMELGLIRRGAKSLLTATVISLAVSAIYFRLTPLTDAGSELLARTQPTTWDVLIALFGGAAGAVGLTRREHGNVIPGVAIATALMPPLCTAGYGLATAHWAYFGGALYLFSINCVFISVSTFLVIQVLPLPHHDFESSQRARRVKTIVWTLAFITAAPSVYLATGIVRNDAFTHNAQRFVDEQLNLPGTYVVTSRLAAGPRTLNVLLAGQRLAPAQLRAARAKLPKYRLAGALLTVRQGLARVDSADARALRASVLADVRSRQQQTLVSYEGRLVELQQRVAHADSIAAPGLPPAAALLREVRAEHPAVRQLGLSRLVQPAADSLRADTAVVVALRVRQALPAAEQQRLAAWLRVRAGGRQPVQLLVTSDAPAARPAKR